MSSVRFARMQDGISLAWTRSGSGPPLVKTSNWLMHLDHDAESPLWSHLPAFFGQHFDYLRYDERGCGLSGRETGELSHETWVDDLERIIEVADLPTPFTLLGMSQGATTAIGYAHRHPDKVARLIINGGYARGAFRRDDPTEASLYRGVVDVIRNGWHVPNPAFREVFTRKFVPDGSPERIGWFNEMIKRATGPEVAERLLIARGEIDVEPLLPEIQCPTLVFHSEDDIAVPLEEGARLARGIPNAEYIVLPSRNHILQVDEPGWATFTSRVLAAAGLDATPSDSALTTREREILRLICEAKSNKAIARELEVSEKTVRNHATNLFAKLGVSSRQEAIRKMAGPV